MTGPTAEGRKATAGTKPGDVGKSGGGADGAEIPPPGREDARGGATKKCEEPRETAAEGGAGRSGEVAGGRGMEEAQGEPEEEAGERAGGNGSPS